MSECFRGIVWREWLFHGHSGQRTFFALALQFLANCWPKMLMISSMSLRAAFVMVSQAPLVPHLVRTYSALQCDVSFQSFVVHLSWGLYSGSNTACPRRGHLWRLCIPPRRWWGGQFTDWHMRRLAPCTLSSPRCCLAHFVSKGTVSSTRQMK